MPIVRYGCQIRLTGKDAELHLMYTRGNKLPSSLKEY
jgi:hypothetical protein